MRWIIFLLIFLLPLTAFAVDAEVKSVTKDTNRNIYWVDVEYTIGTEKVMNSYPIKAYDVVDRTQQELNQFIAQNVRHQCKNYIANEFFKNNNNLQTKVNNMIGQSLTVTEAQITFDFDDDGVIDKTYNIREDGTYEVVP